MSIKTQIALFGVAVVAAVLLMPSLTRKAGQVAADVGAAINPLNQNNVFNTGFNATTKAVTGSDLTLGSWLYEKLNPNWDAGFYETKFNAPVDPYTVNAPEWTAADQDDADLGAAMRGIAFAETTGGAVTGLVRRR